MFFVFVSVFVFQSKLLGDAAVKCTSVHVTILYLSERGQEETPHAE